MLFFCFYSGKALYSSCVIVFGMVYVFVYGILVDRYNGVPARLQGYERFVRCHASIRERLGGCVVGELISVSDDTLKILDRVEGVANGYYHRFLVSVDLDDGGRVEDVWVYQQVVDKGEE